jgi:hypothetical protein
MKGVGLMKYKWVIMQELEESNTAVPYKIVDTEERAEELCLQLEKNHDGFIYWPFMCEEE